MSVPALDPTQPGIFDRILATAAELRAGQRAAAAIAAAQARAARQATLQRDLKRVEVETDVEPGQRYWRTVGDRD